MKKKLFINKILLSALLLLSYPIIAIKPSNLTCNEFDCKKCCEIEEDFYPDTTKAFNESIPEEASHSQAKPQAISFSEEDISIVTNNKNIVFSYLPDQIKSLIIDFLRTKNLENSVTLKNFNEYVKRATNVIPKNEGLQVLGELLKLAQEDKHLNPEILKNIIDYQTQVESDLMNLSIQGPQATNTPNVTKVQALIANNTLLAEVLKELRELKRIILNK